jgi:hypothetical protein
MPVPFAYEDDLCEVLASHLDRVLSSGSNPLPTRTLAQRPVGGVIPDFIYVRSDRLSSSSNAEGLTSIEAAIVATLASGVGLRAEAIADRLYSRIERIAPHLRALERFGVLRRSGDGVLVLRRGALPKRAHVVAVEAKLRRWREAVGQAAAYLSFANQSYVALPDSIVHENEALRAAAAALRIGVLSVGAESVTVARTAPHHRPRSAEWVWLLSRTVEFSRA